MVKRTLLNCASCMPSAEARVHMGQQSAESCAVRSVRRGSGGGGGNRPSGDDINTLTQYFNSSIHLDDADWQTSWGSYPLALLAEGRVTVFPPLLINQLLLRAPENTKKPHCKYLTHYRPAVPFGNRKKIFYRIFSVQYCYNLKNITPLETWNLKI